MTKLPAAGAFGTSDQGLFPLLSPLGLLMLELLPVASTDEAADVPCVGADMWMRESSATAGDSTGAVTINCTLRCTGAMKITGTLRAARLFRFELFFLADTPICIVNSTSTADRATIDIRTGLTIFDSPFASASVPSSLLSGLEDVFVLELRET